MPLFAAQHALFRAYDIRGAQHYFTPEFIQALGEAFAQLYQSQKLKVQNTNVAHHAKPTANHKSNIIVIGYDVRCDSDAIAQTLASILNKYELTVINLGLITTPMMAFWAAQYDGHGIMVTASHSAKDILGIKWLVDNLSPSSAAIQTLYQSLLSTHCAPDSPIQNNDNHSNNRNDAQAYAAQPIPVPASHIISLPANIIATTYIEAIAQVFSRIQQHTNKPSANNKHCASKLDVTIVIDCMHGATSNIAQPLFERFCQQVIMLNDIPDGHFPAGNPDPTEPNRLAGLQQTVLINKADMGLAFDGDGDRLMIVDNSGKVVTPDHLLYLLAQVAMTERPHSIADKTPPQVIFDIKCSHHLSTLLTDLGAMPVMSKTGSSLLRQQLQSCASGAIFAGELSGHFIFNDGYFMAYDDAMYAGLRLLHWLAHTASAGTINAQKTLDANINADTQKQPEAAMLTTDLGGELKPTTSPYQLTDITQNLPMLVSTADHYLPLPESIPTDCSVVQHLAEFCHYLQCLVDGVAISTSTISERTAMKPSCRCFDDILPISSAQAQQLLPAGTRLSCIDGVRLDFAYGFGVLRQSNTSHNLTVRFAGDSITDLKDVQARFVALCCPFDSKLSAQIAAIDPA